MDGLGEITTPHMRKIEVKAPGIMPRESVGASSNGFEVHRFNGADWSRSAWLIIGDRQTEKTAVAIDTIINQKTPMYTASTLPWSKQSTVAQVVEKLKVWGNGVYNCRFGSSS